MYASAARTLPSCACLCLLVSPETQLSTAWHHSRGVLALPAVPCRAKGLSECSGCVPCCLLRPQTATNEGEQMIIVPIFAAKAHAAIISIHTIRISSWRMLRHGCFFYCLFVNKAQLPVVFISLAFRVPKIAQLLINVGRGGEGEASFH